MTLRNSLFGAIDFPAPKLREIGGKCLNLRHSELPQNRENAEKTGNSLFFPCLAGNLMETGSYETAHTTTQPLQTTRFQDDAK
jgi:hypothetical protein